MTSHQDLSHRHLAAFTDWIRPEETTRQTIVQQAGEIRTRIKGQVEADHLTVQSMPDSGSFAKKTGLRRHMRGAAEVEGQDVDLPFVLKRTTADGDRIGDLLGRFDRYAKASYPNTPRRVTNSSVELSFVATQLRYDLVPMLAADMPDYQIILKGDGTRRLTSVAKHTEFVVRRTASSNKQPGRVAFNECVRLMKWWRCIRLGEDGAIEKVSTILIELLCASAYERCGVQPTYTDTLRDWFAWLAHIVGQRIKVKFNDYPSVEAQPSNSYRVNQLWSVLDPVNDTNNVVPADWGNIQLSEFSDWFEAGRDAFARITSLEAAGKTTEMEATLSQLFGPAVITHGAKK